MVTSTEVVSSIPDDKVMSDLKLLGNAIPELIAAYQSVASKNVKVQQYSDAWTGKEFKMALSALSMEEQSDCLKLFKQSVACQAATYCCPKESVAVKDERRFRHKLLLIVTVAACILLFIIVGGVVYVGVRDGGLANSSSLTTILDTAVKLITLVFTSSTGTGM